MLIAPNFRFVGAGFLSACFEADMHLSDARLALRQAWKEGRTGYPWIDAIMVQLRQVRSSRAPGPRACGCVRACVRACLFVCV
jgi:hypothetical protein